ncbi:MAG: hypothetical protein RBU21_15015, partial [FCB group bacterium]|nr:hypothetical protein [FCB group bacterium]
MLKLYLRVLGRTIRVESDNRALLDAVEERYAPYLISMRETDACANGDVSVLELAESDQGLRVGFGGRRILLEGGQSWLKPDDIVIYVLRKLLPNLAFVHASSIQEKGRAALFVGSTHQGKTTLAYALARNGFAPMSDDLAPLDLGSGRVFSLYTSATVRPQTAALAAQHGWPLPHACASSGKNVAEFSAELA